MKTEQYSLPKESEIEHILNQMWPILDSSFPKSERRTWEGQKKLFSNPLYNCRLYKERNCLKGFICYWLFEDFLFVEHVAVNEQFRRQGLGALFLDDMKEIAEKIILEVEPPSEEVFSKRRIRFYERHGFMLNSFYYEQPSLNEWSNKMELKLMSYPAKLDVDSFEQIKDILYKHVYEKP